MNIIETDINDVDERNPNALRLHLADDVVSYIYPFFVLDYSKKIKEIKSLKEAIATKKEKINIEKNNLEVLFKEFSKKDKESQLLRKMGKLIQTGLIQDSMKNEMSVLLQSFESMDEKRIISYLNETIKIISQKFAQL